MPAGAATDCGAAGRSRGSRSSRWPLPAPAGSGRPASGLNKWLGWALKLGLVGLV
ncbi:hypothetical protein, partial [Pseudomonas aeruginosa]|uniref:hypothetical protein n=1 Tax=Pseudomonas aeruginosa TaxID=287 RepID=UPI003967E360